MTNATTLGLKYMCSVIQNDLQEQPDEDLPKTIACVNESTASCMIIECLNDINDNIKIAKKELEGLNSTLDEEDPENDQVGTFLPQINRIINCTKNLVIPAYQQLPIVPLTNTLTEIFTLLSAVTKNRIKYAQKLEKQSKEVLPPGAKRKKGEKSIIPVAPFKKYHHLIISPVAELYSKVSKFIEHVEQDVSGTEKTLIREGRFIPALVFAMEDLELQVAQLKKRLKTDSFDLLEGVGSMRRAIQLDEKEIESWQRGELSADEERPAKKHKHKHSSKKKKKDRDKKKHKKKEKSKKHKKHRHRKRHKVAEEEDEGNNDESEESNEDDDEEEHELKHKRRKK